MVVDVTVEVCEESLQSVLLFIIENTSRMCLGDIKVFLCYSYSMHSLTLTSIYNHVFDLGASYEGCFSSSMMRNIPLN